MFVEKLNVFGKKCFKKVFNNYTATTTSGIMNIFIPTISTFTASGLTSDATAITKTTGINSNVTSPIAVTSPSTASSTVTGSSQGKAKQDTTIALHYNTISKLHTVVASPEDMFSMVTGSVQTPSEEFQYITTSLTVQDKQTLAGPTMPLSSVHFTVSSVYTSTSIILTNGTPSSASNTQKQFYKNTNHFFLYSRSCKSVTYI